MKNVFDHEVRTPIPRVTKTKKIKGSRFCSKCEHGANTDSESLVRDGWVGVLGFHFKVRDATKNGPYLELQGLSAVLVTTDRKPGPSSSFLKKSKISAAPVGAARIFLFGKVSGRLPRPFGPRRFAPASNFFRKEKCPRAAPTDFYFIVFAGYELSQIKFFLRVGSNRAVCFHHPFIRDLGRPRMHARTVLFFHHFFTHDLEGVKVIISD